MSLLQEYEGYIRKRILDDGVSHKELSEELKQLQGCADSTGFSLRSIQRFCHEKDIHKLLNLSQTQMEEAVMAGVAMVSSMHAMCFCMEIQLSPSN